MQAMEVSQARGKEKITFGGIQAGHSIININNQEFLNMSKGRIKWVTNNRRK